MPPPNSDEEVPFANGDAAMTAHLLNEVLRDSGIDRRSAMHSVLRTSIDGRGGDASVAKLAGLNPQDLPDAISPDAMTPLVVLRDLIQAAGWLVEFKAIEINPAS